jgi:NodT family efflux transporter outer membrane factor (OMF) lipoprotein
LLALSLGLTPALASCSLMPSERAHAPALPSAWRDAPVGANVELADWWTSFNDPLLNQLITEALREGPSVQLAALRVQEAHAVANSTIAANLPDITVGGAGQYTETLRRTPGLPAAGGGTQSEQAFGSYGPQASWEVPLFGRILSAAAGARANNASAYADLRGARVALIADVAQAYVDLRTAQNTRAALEQSAQSAEHLADILDTSSHAGITSTADAADARRQAASTRAEVASAIIAERAAENKLAVLRGKAPGTEAADVASGLETMANIPSLPLTGAPAAPADMLRLRPDVARAEAQVLLAAAGLGEARTDLLPQLNLTGAVNISNNIIGSPLGETGAQNTVLTGGALITIPLFDWGSRTAQVRVRNAQFHEALIEYRQTVTQAVAEGSNALVSLEQGARRLAATRTAETAATTSANGARQAQQAGIESLADRLRAEQLEIDARISRINAEQSEATAAINVYRAFGGGAQLPR